MALALQTVLSSSSIDNGRVIWNNNFTIVQDQINNFLRYFDTNTVQLTGINSINTLSLVVGSNKLLVNSSNPTILNDSITISGNTTVRGNLMESNISPIINDAVSASQIYDIGSVSSVPTYYIYKVTSSITGGLTFRLFPGINGQKVRFVFVQDTSNSETNINIQVGGSSTFNLPAGDSYIKLTAINQSVELMYITDGWYILSGFNYTLV